MVRLLFSLLISFSAAVIVASEGYFESNEIDYWGDKIKAKKPEEPKKELVRPRTLRMAEDQTAQDVGELSEDDKYMIKYKDSVWAKKSMGPDGRVYVTLPLRQAVEAIEETDPVKKKEKVEIYLAYQREKIAKINAMGPFMMDSALDMKIITAENFVVEAPEPKEDITSALLGRDFKSANVPVVMRDDNGSTLTLINRIPGELKHQVAVLYFFDYDCHFCQKQRPEVEAFVKKFSDSIDFRGIYAGNPRSYIKEATFLQETGKPVPFKTYSDKFPEKKEYYSDHFQVKGTPTMIFINTKDGRSTRILDGNVGLSGMEAALQAVAK